MTDQGVTCTNGQVPIPNTNNLNDLSSSDRLPRSNVGRETKCPNVGWTSPVALVASLSRFLVVAKSYGGQFRSIWEHCLLYSNGSTDGDVNKSIEICPTHMVEADHSDVLKNSYLRPRIGFKL